MFRSIVLVLVGLASLSAGSLFAQDAVLGQKYGLGVHAYFAGDYLKAMASVSSPPPQPTSSQTRPGGGASQVRNDWATICFQRAAWIPHAVALA